jgi:hypothetical protein
VRCGTPHSNSQARVPVGGKVFAFYSSSLHFAALP